MASRIWHGAVVVISLCAVLVERGACDVQACESAQIISCFPAGVVRVPKVEFKIQDFTMDSLKKDCKNADAISTCVNNLKIDGCQDEERRQLQFLKDGLRSTRNSLCHENLYQSMEEWNRCLNKTMFDECIREYKYERKTLEETRRLTRDERECSYGKYACILKAAEDCPSTSLARKALNDFRNTIFDLGHCPRFDGSSGKQRCDAERFLGCFARAMDSVIFPEGHDDKSLAKDCKVVESVDSCTKYMEIGGCSDESKQRLQYVKSDFASLRSHICDTNFHKSTLEWNQCIEISALKSCWSLVPYDQCSHGQYNCFLNATTRCTRDSPAMKAVHHLFNTHHDLKNCSRVDWNDGNSGITTSPKILLTLAALCISLFSLRK
uniref:Putative secreted protein n=2 Tax=Ixodes ricinus TaxID=34613 RepID=A0A090X9D1_IXORI